MRFGLMLKFAIISAIVLVFTMVVFTLFNIAALKGAFMELYTKDVDNLAETILHTTYHAMMVGEVEEAYTLMRRAGTQENIKNVRLIDKHGVVRFSLDTGESGTRIDKGEDPGCRMCHQESSPRIEASAMDRSRIFKDRDGEEVLAITKAIYNDSGCSSASCHYHSPEAKLLGVLDIVVSTSSILAQVAAYRNSVTIELVFLVIALALCLNLLIRKLITQPVTTLLEHTRALSKGDWRIIEDPPTDEFGELAEAFNEMTRNLKKAREDRDRWAATLESRVEERTRRIKEMQSVLIRSEKLASLGELAAGIAHELNNPLTGIVLHASIVEKSADLEPELQRDLQTVTDEAERCARIVKNLLDFSRKTEPRKSMNSINDTLDRALGLVEHLSSFYDISILKDYAENLPDLHIDAGQMEQVFVNMFVNASQAMEEGGSLTIWTGFGDLSGDTVVIKIQDTGCGIPEENLGKVFDPFFSTKGARGTGLGLSVSYGIVEGHGGTVAVSSTLNEGTAFTITLPV